MINRVHRARAAIVASSVLLLAGCGGGAAERLGTGGSPSRHGEATAAPAPTASRAAATGRLPGLGPRTLAAIPARTRQAVVVTGRDRDSSLSGVVLYERTEAGWRAGPRRPARNALKGWTDHHRSGDLRSPIGVFTLTDAGGLRPDPGTRLPYDRSGAFTSPGTGFEGESLDGSFDYVVAVNYNRRPGTTPLDWTRPMGASRGGGIWLHVDHGGPTHGCVGLREGDLVTLMRALDPALHPVVVMGDAASLAR
ncbi:L,D-transpeptidase family protein [Streptomyces aureus]|uniref:L,D-transpeptidase family protein n=1 Tax=Streptomyces aureus TaxID=193461 RepID=UPI0005669509|nr:L,D-transpeptidase family protein [Streptomyces aureus]